MKEKSKGSGRLLWVGIALLIFLLAILTAKKIVESKLPGSLQSAIRDQSGGLYQIRFGEVKLDLWKGAFIAESVHLVPDTANRKKLKEQGLTTLFEVKAKRIAIGGFQLLKFFWRDELHVSNIVINQPAVIQYTFASVRKKKDKGLRQELQEIKNQIAIKEITLSEIQYRIVDMQTKKSAWLKNINFHASEIQFGQKAKRQDATNVNWIGSFHFYGNNVVYLSGDELYRLRMAHLDISSERNKLLIDSFSIVPNYTEEQWSKTLLYKKDRYAMVFPRIEAFRMGFAEWLNKGYLQADSLIIDRATIQVYADKGMREKTTQASDNFPSLAFQRLGVPLTIKEIFIRNTDVYYKERNPKSGRAGLVFFKQLNARLQHVSNDSLQLQHDPWVKGHFSTFFLGKPKLTLDLDFNVLDTTGAFRYKGTLEGAPANFYNQLLEPVTLARAEDGYVRSVRFSITANRYGAKVETEMLYNDLKVAMLDASSGELQKKGFLSLFVNWLAIKADNPSKKGELPRIAHLYYKHPPEKTFFNLMWKALYTGLKVNLGLPEI
ncbi:hypothetical protein RYH73_00610 [Olivibacter sp. CPCC 100613]|uniref:hypothetical protein n=1 Tax=Olivibacter sp. CPCC 100613 TaxID=3079931 RepID=UPI002FF6E99C